MSGHDIELNTAPTSPTMLPGNSDRATSLERLFESRRLENAFSAKEISLTEIEQAIDCLLANCVSQSEELKCLARINEILSNPDHLGRVYEANISCSERFQWMQAES